MGRNLVNERSLYVSDNKQNWPNKARQDQGLDELKRAIKSRERQAKIAPLGVVLATVTLSLIHI